MTEQNIYILKDLFYRVKQFYFGTSDKTLSAANMSSGEASEYIAALKEAEKDLFTENDGSCPDDADTMLLCALRLIKEALTEKNFRLAGDIADAAVHLSGVYTFPYLSRKRFFDKHLTPLREKHEQAFFSEEEALFLSGENTKIRLRPVFRRPHHADYYYEEDSDSEMAKAHPILYTLFAVMGILLFVGSIAAYGILTVALSLSGAWCILGYFGAILLGISLFSLLMAWIRQYMGHILTVSAFLIGLISITTSILLL